MSLLVATTLGFLEAGSAATCVDDVCLEAYRCQPSSSQSQIPVFFLGLKDLADIAGYCVYEGVGMFRESGGVTRPFLRLAACRRSLLPLTEHEHHCLVIR